VRYLAAAASLLVLVSCGSRNVAVNQGKQTAEDLWGRTFVSVAVTEDGEPRPLIPGTRIKLTFEQREDEGIIGWEAGCNLHGARVDITPQRLHLRQMAGTDMGCTDELHEQDQWLGALFNSDPHWELREDRLMLTFGGTSIELKGNRD
jgi:heat shock protein HslJ